MPLPLMYPSFFIFFLLLKPCRYERNSIYFTLNNLFEYKYNRNDESALFKDQKYSEKAYIALLKN